MMLTLVAVLVATGCGEGDGPTPLSEAEACKAVEEKLTLEQLEERFGEPDGSQDFFGDRVVAYQDDEVRWQFQVGTRNGTFRALQVKGQREEVLDCPA
jgi:hypothetical protein